jgi:hypothetical protein
MACCREVCGVSGFWAAVEGEPNPFTPKLKSEFVSMGGFSVARFPRLEGFGEFPSKEAGVFDGRMLRKLSNRGLDPGVE